MLQHAHRIKTIDDPKQCAGAVDQFTLKHDEFERALDGLRRAAPSARFAALSLARRNRYVLETRRSDADERFRVVVRGMSHLY
jgi:hypothetical protein